MKGAFLDWDSLNGDELDSSCLDNLSVEWSFYPKIQKQELDQAIEQYDILVTNKVLLDRPLLEKASQLKLICVAATGTNNIDLGTANELNIPVCNVTAYATESVVQHVFMLIFNLARQFVPYMNDVQNGQWQKSDFFCLLNHPIQSVCGKTIGIIGYGELGQAVAKTAKHFGMKVLVAESLSGLVKSADTKRLALNDVLANSDIISLHCPLTEQSTNLIDKTAFSKMKPTAILINTARGGIVNEADLLEALTEKQIAAVALDVLDKEPPNDNHPLLTAKLDNLIITPHIAWASHEARQLLLDKITQNILAWKDNDLINEVRA